MESNLIFVIVFFIVTVGQIALLLSGYSRTVSANDVSKEIDKFRDTRLFREDYVIADNERIDVSKHMSLIVCGDSMQKYDIHDGDRIYIKRYSSEDSNSIEKRPILVMRYKHKSIFHRMVYSNYFLMKFIGYVEDLSVAEKLYKEDMGVSLERFMNDLRKSIDMFEKKNGKVLLGEFFDVELQRNVYSLYEANDVIGSADYRTQMGGNLKTQGLTCQKL